MCALLSPGLEERGKKGNSDKPSSAHAMSRFRIADDRKSRASLESWMGARFSLTTEPAHQWTMVLQ